MANFVCIWKKFIAIFVFLIFQITNSEVVRNLTLHLNPHCDDYPECRSSKVVIFYVQAIGPNDTLHYLWSTEGGIPSALIVQTNLNTHLKINWTSLLSSNPDNAISFTETPFYSFGILLTRLLQFVDKDDTGSMSGYNCEAIDFSSINWTASNITTNENNHCSITFHTIKNSTEFLIGGSIYFKLSAYGDRNRGDKLPQLLHNSNNNEIGIILDNLATNSSESRFALEFMAVSNFEEENSLLYKKEKNNLDDEYTPGVFTSVELLTPSSNCSDLCSSYLFWKPIAYSDKELTSSTDVTIYSITQNGTVPFNNIISAYFGFNKTVQTAMWNISFGMKGDKFYSNTKYMSWYLTIGLGVPPEDTPSLAIILTISIGFGAPFVCMIGGSIYMGIRKFLKKEDDLLLSRESM